MKVLILATEIFARGGIARYTWTLASVLGGLVGPENTHVLALLKSCHFGANPSSFRILDEISEKPTAVAKALFSEKALRLAARRYDLIICSHVALAPIGGLIRGFFGTPFWVACHDAEVWDRLSLPKLAGLKRAQLALPVSQFTAKKVSEVNGFPHERVRVVYNAIPTAFAETLLCWNGRSSLCLERKRPERVLLSVGSLARAHAYKGFDTVVRSLPLLLEEIPNLRYTIVGEGDDRTRLEGLARQVGIRDKVTFAGRLSDLELAACYHACDVFVLPSRAAKTNGRWHGEGFGRVYVEAALAGKPVVGSYQGGAAEAAMHAVTGFLVDPTSAEALARATLQLLQNEQLARRMGEAGRRWAAERFTEEAMHKSLADLLNASEDGPAKALATPREGA